MFLRCDRRDSTATKTSMLKVFLRYDQRDSKCAEFPQLQYGSFVEFLFTAHVASNKVLQRVWSPTNENWVPQAKISSLYQICRDSKFSTSQQVDGILFSHSLVVLVRTRTLEVCTPQRLLESWFGYRRQRAEMDPGTTAQGSQFPIRREELRASYRAGNIRLRRLWSIADPGTLRL